MALFSRERTARGRSAAREAVCVGVFAAITAVLSQLSIPIGPVPISCSLVAVYLSGLLLPVKSAVMSQLVYLLLGLAGVPVFAGFQAGAARLAGPTGGYLLVYPVLALLVSLCMLRFDRTLRQKPLAKRAAALGGILLLALAICYLCGTAWFTVFSGTGFASALALTALPFLAGDMAKIVLCVALTLLSRDRLQKVVRGRL